MKQMEAMTLFIISVFVSIILVAAGIFIFLRTRGCRVSWSRAQATRPYTPHGLYTSRRGYLEHGSGRENPRWYSRPWESTWYTPATLPTTNPNSGQALAAHRRNPFFNPHLFGLPVGSSGMILGASESFKRDMICVSPSNPVLVGNEDGGQEVVKLMVTPPTPAKQKNELKMGVTKRGQLKEVDELGECQTNGEENKDGDSSVESTVTR